jgi:hypothetical protein
LNRSRLKFWGSAAAVALLFAALTAAFLPYESLRLHTPPERERAWLLTLWTGGVVSILFGLSARLGAFGGIGLREVVDAGSIQEATRRHRERLKAGQDDEFASSFDSWLIVTGLMLIGVYFAAWLYLR